MKKSIIYFVMAVLFIVGCEDTALNDRDDSQSSVQVTKTSIPSNSKGSDNEESDSDKYVTVTRNKDGQVFHVISAYKWIDQYFQRIENVKSENERSELWREIVMPNIQDQCFIGVYSDRVEDYVYAPPKDLERIKSNVTVLNASNIENIILKALKASASEFPGPDTTVCLLPHENAYHVGLNIGAGRISIFYSSSYSKSLIKSTVAHEYHHSTWKAKYSENYKRDLLGTIILEGKAEYFASLIFGQTVTAAFNYMSDEEENRLWNRVKDSLHSTNRDKITTVLLGGKKGFPSGFGYIIGYHIVRDYVESHPNTSIDELTKLSPKKVYEKSGYEDSF